MADSVKTWRLGSAPWAGIEKTVARARVIIDNDFSGDPDDFYQLVHHLLSPTVEIPFIVATRGLWCVVRRCRFRTGRPLLPRPLSSGLSPRRCARTLTSRSTTPQGVG